MGWTLEHIESATEQSVADWGLAGLVITRVSQGVDTLVFTELNAAYDQAPTFAFDDTVKLKKDTVTVFAGRVQRPKSVNSITETRQYTVAGPWSWLEQIVYQQEWHTTNGLDATVIEERRSRIVLGQDKDGAKIATAVEMTAAVQWAIDNGADIAIGTIDASVTIPYQELVDVTCAELIRACLRWTPDAQAWFDYTTTTPTLHIRRRASLSPVTLSLNPTTANIEAGGLASTSVLRAPTLSEQASGSIAVGGLASASALRAPTLSEQANGSITVGGLASTSALRAPTSIAEPSTPDFLSFDGVDDYLTTPDSPENPIAGDFEFVIRLSLPAIPPAAGGILISKVQFSSPSNQKSYEVWIHPSGHIWAQLFATGGSSTQSRYSVPLQDESVPANTPIWLRVTWTDTTDSMTYGWSASTSYPASWTTIPNGTQNDYGSGALFDSSLPLAIGARPDGTQPFLGKIYEAYLYDGIGGTLVAKFDAADGSDPSYNNVAGQTAWTNSGATPGND